MRNILKLKILEFLKIPEGIYIPFFGWRYYSMITKLENKYLKKCIIPDNPLNNQSREQPIIVSLTSYPARIDTAFYAIKSLMLQSYKPDKIILWLAKNQFENKVLPENFNELIAKGLEIRFCPDLKSHKKYFYAMQEQENNLLITYDDDIIYPLNSIKQLIKCHYKYPKCIICNRGFEILFDNNRNIMDVKKWKILTNEGVKRPSIKIMPSTGGGCLYPPNSVSSKVFDWEVIENNALTADDLWMKAMGLLKGTEVVKTSKFSKTFSIINGSQTDHLGYTNIILGQNNAVVKNLLNLYPTLFDDVKKP